ncbi:twin-arginine translocase TatA/TatE family subunit [Oceanibaculum nanhaiense]|jgi:sec-independent protein translocase protein TatA|uniref:twin-arginine translocase TatA/TatE family subunit n=1 Tax=Oceanibaculum nanhaiense TaxID=1909734 RepID=UPI000A389FDF|nr:twin-arginine translocase TatA/TatE family subunit [Oceanibaculum nanhaiense]MBC7134196.1 twin-arginine translocase TatA/TatE family subunit [Oceanibaculum nanhaiense]MDM7947823.1 twin-arginine translocase TatA/TatE family subunit [Oceanibaculum nanhaiense]
MSIGFWQVILILVIVLIIFGAGKLPKVMGDVAKGVKSFKSGMKDEEETTSEPAKTLDQTPSQTADTASAPSTAPDESKKNEPAKS